ncbi:MAG: NAD(P)H-hydrate epimerase [bacterium]|nr:NAD(P)H-hydrate epimerase [bacterium]
MSRFPVISSGQMAVVDRVAVEEGLLIIQMMEYAGLNIARFVQSSHYSSILILAGKGHNGGDGIAAARHLKNWGYKVRVILAEEPSELKEVSRHHFDLLEKMNVEMKVWDGDLGEEDLIIDALLGYNIDGDPRAVYGEIISVANDSVADILAVDLPSGMNGTTGKAYNPCIKADKTLTLALPKIGLLKGIEYTGELFVADLGIPEEVFKKAGLDIPVGLFRSDSIQKFS